MRDVLAEGPQVKTDFHRELTERVPEDLRWWCKGCGEHHVHPSLWRATGIRGVLAIVGRDGRSPVFGAPPPAPPVDDPGGELARRYLQVPRPRHAAAVPATGLSHAPAREAAVGARGRARRGRVEGEGWVLAEDAALDAAAPKGVRLLPNLDPLASAKDREVLVPDAAVRKRIWARSAAPGWRSSTARSPALWRPRKKGKRLVVELEPLRSQRPPRARRRSPRRPSASPRSAGPRPPSSPSLSPQLLGLRPNNCRLGGPQRVNSGS